MPFQILSLSGGGFLGLYSVTILAHIEERLGKPIASCFDLLTGTSIGGIVALALAAEIPADVIRKNFEAKGTSIFSERPAPQGIASKFDLTRSALKPKYDGVALKEAINSIIGADKKIGDLLHPVIVPAVNLTKGGPQFFKTPHHPDFKRDLLLPIVDVALATSAAPTYFPLAEIGDELFADGGLYANSPDLAALHEAEHFFKIAATDVRMLSIGTTTSQFSFSHTVGKDLGIIGWAQEQRLLRASMSSQQLYSHYVMQHKLQDRYVRIDATQSREQERDLALDVANKDAQKTIRGMASVSYQNEMNNNILKLILGHTAAAPVFYDPKTEKPRTKL